MGFFNSVSYAQNSYVSDSYAGLEAVDLLNLIRTDKNLNQSSKLNLAKLALKKAEDEELTRLRAESHNQLARLFEENKDNKNAEFHFAQSAAIYKEMADKRKQFLVIIEYLELLELQQRFSDTETLLSELNVLVDSIAVPEYRGLYFFALADIEYAQRRFEQAIVYYKQAAEYFGFANKINTKRSANAYKMLAQSYKRLKDRELTAHFYRKALEAFTLLQDDRLIARTLNTLAEAERYLGNYNVALDHLNRSLQLFEGLNDPEGAAKAQMSAGIIYRHIGRYEKSLQYVYDAYLYYKQVNYSNGVAKTSNQIGHIYVRLLQFSNARKYFQTTIDLPERELDQDTLASAFREIAVIDLESGDYSVAMQNAKKALRIYREAGDKTKESLASRITANTYRAQGYNNKAIDYYQKSIELAREQNHKLYQIKAIIPLTDLLIENRTDEAVDYLTEALQLTDEINAKNQKIYIYRRLREAEKIRKNYADALYYSEQQLIITEIIQTENDNKQLNLEKAKLYSLQTELELNALREKEKLHNLEMSHKNHEIEIVNQANLISELKLAKTRYTSVALALLLAICILIVFFIYRRFVKSRSQNKDLDYLAARDPLTNCYNRRVLFDVLDRDFENLERFSDYCIIMADIDYFKKVNDTHQHTGGDAVLTGVAGILKDGVRQNDIAARFGGEEFCLVLPGADKTQAINIAQSLRKKVEESRFEGIPVTCSFGVASITGGASTPTELIKHADLALYESKRLGRNRVSLWQGNKR